MYPIIYLSIYLSMYISLYLLTILWKDGECYPIGQRYPIICLSIYLLIYKYVFLPTILWEDIECYPIWQRYPIIYLSAIYLYFLFHYLSYYLSDTYILLEDSKCCTQLFIWLSFYLTFCLSIHLSRSSFLFIRKHKVKDLSIININEGKM